MNSLPLFLPLTCLVELVVAGPLGKEPYPMPPSVLQALSSRGTLVLEAAMKSALLALERALAEHSRQLQECDDCVPCLFVDCGNHTRECTSPGSPSGSQADCEAVLQAQATPEQPARNWALSKACAPYRHLCSGWERGSAGCLRLMAEHCQLRLQECRLESDMDYLNTVADQSVPGVCGRRGVPAPNVTTVQGKIVGGHRAWHGAWPWLVSVRLNEELMCGGVLVGELWVLTAAHCFAGSRNELAWSVVLGDYDLTKSDEGERAVPVSRILSHPKFNPKTFHNDVALLELSSPVVPSAWVTPVCLPDRPADPAVGTLCNIVGWGSVYEDGAAADVVMEARVPVLAQDICRSTLGRQLFTSAMFCAGYLSGGIDSCQGDSGGPLTCWDPLSERYVLYGITSWGDGCGAPGKPGVYTRVTAFTDWIHQQIQNLPSSREPSCFELLALTQLPQEKQWEELSRLCAFFHATESRVPSPLSDSRALHLKATKRSARRRSNSVNCAPTPRLCWSSCTGPKSFSGLKSTSRSSHIPFRNSWSKFTGASFLLGCGGNPQGSDPESVIAEGEEGGKRGVKMQKREAQTLQKRSPATAHPSFASLFQGTGPSLDDWVQTLTAMTEGSRIGSSGEEQLFLQQADGRMEELQAQGWLFIQQLRRELSPEGAFPDVELEQEVAGASPASNKSLEGGTQRWREKRSRGASPEGEKDHSFPKVASAAGSNCPGLNESTQQVQSVRELYCWILQVPERDLAMTFQEILVDLNSKNSKGLFRARIRAVVGGKAVTFAGLVGLANDSLYRSMPGLVALALESLKT
ncbi:serine protease 56 [Sphaerodactylus townsendi]|uniref:serine protease 56 n=1 Tax=Sphaerodactylus townsendi TaxID=933632 RepID=UPI0020266285|nr:serine protease 56 [Sphaerodactylus townsendi]